ncbi:hypothetical protein J4573_42385 [Actinomadura barringtoniae]|uniref:Uncharacterized protein n=1 Tax=Actinomadura barringtoniae TaxID=1427535 RepID=A0A939PRG8_9ACTN|nr:hypothetical protein [Actinomadura barringtoniae]MBO2453799.1 hypothetical protein [Actinomadura barringtoniae]
MSADWWSIEVFGNDAQSGAAWRAAWEENLIESALTNGADEWEWHEHTWGVVLELHFPDELRWNEWRELPGTRAALDSVPDPVDGLLIYRGRGGSSGSPVPRRPLPAPGAAAMELEPPPEETRIGLERILPEDPLADAAAAVAG